mmetsp:Transcript_13175/g.23894  ORF Transcript_13175/g.23894 Transcript_13175/m.23894 type:complete len:347 (-) Transcript_13175:348-1388(-)
MTSSAEKELPQLTPNDVKHLPQALEHIWKVVVYQEENPLIVGVMDMTNQIREQAAIPRAMRFCSIDRKDGGRGPPSQTQLLNVIFNAMKDPSCREDGDPFYCPRRPRFMLLDPALEATFPYVKSQIELLNVPVRVYTETTYIEAVLAVEAAMSKPGDGYDCTYGPGLFTATAAIVAQLPQDTKETWKVFLYHHEDSPTGSILVVENHTDKRNKTLVGNGVTGVCNVGQGILAVMMCPMLGKTGGNGGSEPDTPRRPGRIVLHAALETDMEHIGEVLLGSGVEILKDSEYSGKYGFCHNQACNIANPFGKKDRFMACQCKAVAYCDKICQKADWKEHKKTCEWFANK